MFISSLHVRNYRCIADATLRCEPLTTLVGPNGCGKSTFLTALQLFFAESARTSEEDYYAKDHSNDIEVTVTVCELPKDLDGRYDEFMVDGELQLTRIFSLADPRRSGKIYGRKLGISQFAEVRSAPNATAAKEKYNELRESEPFCSLADWKSREGAYAALREWEDKHPEHCTSVLDAGDFFNIGKGGPGDLRRLVQFVFVPAVNDTEGDSLDGKGSAATELFDFLVRNRLAEREDYLELRDHVRAGYERILSNAKANELAAVQDRLTKSLQTFVPNSSVIMQWLPPVPIELPLPRAEIQLDEDGYCSPVGRTGHGMQRAFNLSLLQELAAAKRDSDSSNTTGGDFRDIESSRTLILAIEEPELFQHPNRQRSIARTLDRLTQGTIPGVAERTQVIYATHNPHFVSLNRFHQVRVLNKEPAPGNLPRSTRVRSVDRQAVVDELRKARQGKGAAQSWEVIEAKLVSIMTPLVNEGFFADAVVLVEGDVDRAAVMAAASLAGVELEDIGISVISCRGKANISRPLVIFRQFGLNTYTIWDSDKGRKQPDTESNRLLQRLLWCEPLDYPETQVKASFACFETDLETTVRAELRPFYDEFGASCKEEFGASMSDGAIKHPAVFESLLNGAAERGIRSNTLEQIAEKILQSVH